MSWAKLKQVSPPLFKKSSYHHLPTYTICKEAGHHMVSGVPKCSQDLSVKQKPHPVLLAHHDLRSRFEQWEHLVGMMSWHCGCVKVPHLCCLHR